MLGGIGSTNLDIKLVATVTGADDNGAANEPAKRFKNFLAELLQCGDVLGGDSVVDSTSLGRSGTLEFSERKVLGKAKR